MRAPGKAQYWKLERDAEEHFIWFLAEQMREPDIDKILQLPYRTLANWNTWYARKQQIEELEIAEMKARSARA